jgi:glutathione peroxidase
MMSKVSVKGDDQAPLFQYLTTANNPDKEGDIGWNFEKFLVGKDGKVLRRFTTQVQPDDSAVTEAIEAAIKG